jgi:hypothetical protein
MVMEKPACKVFNGRYTIESTRTGEHRTFRIATQAADAEFAPGQRVVSLFTGTENDNPDHYTGFAFIDDRGIHVWTSKRWSPLWLQYADMLWSLALDAGFSPWADRGYRLHLEGRCLVCNRTLTTPESIRRGVGPICAEGGL